MNNEDFEKLLKERTDNELLSLFQEFKQIDNYGQKLDFWRKHFLGLKLYYSKIHGFSIIPFDNSEVRKFTEWAIPFRDDLRDFIESQPLKKQARLRLICECEFGESFEFRKQEFWRKYNLNIDPKAFAELEIKEYEESNKTRFLRHALLGGDVDFYKLVLYCFDKSQDEQEILTHHLPIGVHRWEKIDFVLRIREDRKYKVFLEQLKQKNALNQPITPTPSNKEATQRQYALYYYYLQESGDYPQFQSGNKEKDIKGIATKHEFSWKNFQEKYNDITRPNNEGKEYRQKYPKDLKKVIEMLSDYPKAQDIARQDLDSLKNS